MTTSPAVEADSVSVERGGRRVIREVSFAVRPGQVVGLIGPSGCGKTTLMRSIVGVQTRVTGTLRVLGRWAGAPGNRARIGYVAQDPAVYAELTVRENLWYFGGVMGIRRDRVEGIIGTVRLDDVADALVRELSGGQVARVSLAVALLNAPDLLVLDEPTVGLDPVLRQELWREFDGLAGRGATLIVSSHVMEEAHRCDSLLLMRTGRIIASGSPADLMASTDTATVEAAFLALVEDDERC